MVTERGDRVFYRWRQMTDAQRGAVLSYRRGHRLPWHSPPHYNSESETYLVTAACYEHQPVIGHSPDRMSAFAKALVETCQENQWPLYAWIVLPNHYHFLARSSDAKAMITTLGRLHGKTSFEWNGDEACRGRKVWCNAAETGIKSERHFWASLLYVMNNAVKHGYVERWQDWPFSNATEWLESVGRERTVLIWHEYPIDDFGNDWDPADL